MSAYLTKKQDGVDGITRRELEKLMQEYLSRGGRIHRITQEELRTKLDKFNLLTKWNLKKK